MTSGIALAQALPLFPLNTVLFPGGQLALRVFEARYLDLMSWCLREGCGFGVVCLKQGSEAGRSEQPVELEPVGTLAHLDEVDADGPGLLSVRCVGGSRFSFATRRCQPDGLWLAEGVTLLDDDPPAPPGPRFVEATEALSRALAALALRAASQVPVDRRLDDAGWVANRWCELLPLPRDDQQAWMALADPLERLARVDAFLRQHRVI
jgi:uncharacterized protein